MIPYGRQNITEADIESVLSVLKSDFLTQGPQVPIFEKTVLETVGARHAVAVNSATSALHIACLALDLGPGDYIWTTPITFVASANCGLYCGAKVDFVDIDPRTYNMCPQVLESKLVKAKELGKLPKVLVPVHLCGQSCDMAAIHKLAEKYNFKIIEDASHAIGGKYKGQLIGNCQYSAVTIFSFHPVKIITTAEGGMAVTNDSTLANKMSLLRSHGITRDPQNMTQVPDGPWYYQQIALGYNYRMTDLQAALGVSQMCRLASIVEKRNEIANRYNRLLNQLPLILPWQNPDTFSAHHLYVIRLKVGEIRKTHCQVFEHLRERGIGVNLHYIPVHTQPYYREMGFKPWDFPESEKYYREAISLPIYENLSNDQQNEVIKALKDVLRG